MISLTTKQLRALQFIAGHIETNGQPPSYDEIARGLGLCARSGVFRLVRGLRERGAITWAANRHRALTIERPVTIPRSPDGEPLYFVEVR